MSRVPSVLCFGLIIPALVGSAVWWQQQRSSADRRPVDMPPSDLCELSVLDARGEPVPRARVLLPDAPGARQAHWTDAAGRVRVHVDPEQRTDVVVVHPEHAMTRLSARAGRRTVHLAPLHRAPLELAAPGGDVTIPEDVHVAVVPVPRHGDAIARRLPLLEQPLVPGRRTSIAVPRRGPYALRFTLIGDDGRRVSLVAPESMIVEIDGGGRMISASAPLDAWRSAIDAVGRHGPEDGSSTGGGGQRR